MGIDVLIIGAGIVGLACAREAVRKNYSTVVVEQHNSFGQETSSRNSEVVHSGIYYKPGSLKAKFCVAGNRRIYKECEQFGVWSNQCGKLIVAVNEREVIQLEQLKQRGFENGVENLEILNASQVKLIEPYIKCVSALYVPSTGIVDTHGLMKAYYNESISLGAIFLFRTKYERLERQGEYYKVAVRDAKGNIEEIDTRFVINSAGLSADKVAESFGIDIDKQGYRIHPNRGHYFRVSLQKSMLISHLIYPVPNPDMVSLGIHVTLDRQGQVKLGPDHEYINAGIPETEWYKFDSDETARKDKFLKSVSQFFPELKSDDLIPDQVGVRPKLQTAGEPPRDFIVSEESKLGLPGIVNLIGIESPGLTCAGEIGVEVIKLLEV